MASHGHKNQKLVLGPWGHTDQATRLGPLLTDFGENAIIDLSRSYTRWLDHWLLGIDNGIDTEPLVSLFVMGSNQWIHGETYPLPETEFTKYYLTSQGNANTSAGDGGLSILLPDETIVPTDVYTYDPGDPTPDPTFYYDLDAQKDTCTKETADKPDTTCVESVEEKIAKHIAFYDRINKLRRDILVYETAPMEQALTFAGPISAVLYAASSAKDTDWFTRLSMIRENGDVYPLVHGVIRARYRNSFSEPEMLEPGQIYEYHLDMWQTGITVPVGAKLRVEVSSAAFPMFSRNLNTGGHNETETEYTIANQVIYHTQDHPSHILLPVIRDFNPE
jgi:predicted acyl esterase